MLLLNAALRFCRLPCESQVLKRLETVWAGWTSPTDQDLPLPVPVTWRTNFTTTLTGLARQFIPESTLRVRPHATPPWGLSKRGDRLLLDPSTCKGNARLALVQEIHSLSTAAHTLLLFATEGTATQGEGNKAKLWHATSVIAYHQGPEAHHGERLIGMDMAGDLIAARAIESAATMAQTILVEWQANHRPAPDHIVIVTNNAGSIHCITNLGPHPTQQVSINFRNIADQLLNVFPRLQITLRWALATCQPPGFK
jgi:hypothetical protein